MPGPNSLENKDEYFIGEWMSAKLGNTLITLQNLPLSQELKRVMVHEMTKKIACDDTWDVKRRHHRFIMCLSLVSKQLHLPKNPDTKTHYTTLESSTLLPQANTYTMKAFFFASLPGGDYIFLSVAVYAHARMAVVHCNPHVVSPWCQEPICLHYHHTARGSRSVGARGDCNASLSHKKTPLHCLDICHVIPTH